MPLTRLSLFSWLVSLEALDTPPERPAALRAGYDLACALLPVRSSVTTAGVLAERPGEEGHGYGEAAEQLSEVMGGRVSAAAWRTTAS